jgi:pilus assembly protein Flp/PilA
MPAGPLLSRVAREREEGATREMVTRQDQDGASAVEYGMLVALIAGVIVLAVWAMGTLVSDGVSDTCGSFDSVAASSPDPANAADCSQD